MIGLLLATGGIVFATSGARGFDLGAVLIALGAVAYALYTVILRRIDQAHTGAPDPLSLASATAVWGIIFLLPWMLWELSTGQSRLVATSETVAAILYLGLCASGLTLLLWTYGAGRLPALTSGILTAAIPALGYLCALLVGEAPTLNRTIGGAIGLVGVGLAIVGGRQTRPSQIS